MVCSNYQEHAFKKGKCLNCGESAAAHGVSSPPENKEPAPASPQIKRTTTPAPKVPCSKYISSGFFSRSCKTCGLTEAQHKAQAAIASTSALLAIAPTTTTTVVATVPTPTTTVSATTSSATNLAPVVQSSTYRERAQSAVAEKPCDRYEKHAFKVDVCRNCNHLKNKHQISSEDTPPPEIKKDPIPVGATGRKSSLTRLPPELLKEEEQVRKKKEEDARKKKEDDERLKREEDERKQREEDERKQREEDERKQREEDDRRIAEEERRKEEERIRLIEEARRKKEADERRIKDDESERKARDEIERVVKEKDERKKEIR